MPSLALNASQTKILTPAKSKVASRGLRSLACWSGRLKRPSSSFLTDSQLMRANVLNSGSIWLALKAKRKEEKATRIWNGNEGVFHGVTSDVTATTAHHRERQAKADAMAFAEKMRPIFVTLG